MAFLRDNNVIFYHPLNTKTEFTQSETWQGPASFVDGKINNAAAAFPQDDLSVGTPSSGLGTGTEDRQHIIPRHIDENKVLLVQNNWEGSASVAGFNAYVAEISGTDIIIGPENDLLSDRQTSTFLLEKLTSHKFSLFYKDNTVNPRVTILDVSGETVTAGPKIDFGGAFNSVTQSQVALSEDKILVGLANNSGGGRALTFWCGTVSGTDVDFGPAFVAASSASTVSWTHKTARINDNKAAVVFQDDNDLGHMKGVQLNISGNTITGSGNVDTFIENDANIQAIMQVAPDLHILGWQSGTSVADPKFLYFLEVSGNSLIFTSGISTIEETPGSQSDARRLQEISIFQSGSAGKGAVSYIGRDTDLSTGDMYLETFNFDANNKTMSQGARTKLTTSGDLTDNFVINDIGKLTTLDNTRAVVGVKEDIPSEDTSKAVAVILDSTLNIESQSGSLYPTNSGADRIATACWTNNVPGNSSGLFLNRDYEVGVSLESGITLASGNTSGDGASWNSSDIFNQIINANSGINDGNDHFLVMDFEHSGGSSWILHTSLDGNPYINRGVQNSGSLSVLTTPNNPKITVLDPHSNQWLDEAILWGGDKTTFDIFSDKELLRLWALANSFNQPMNQYSEFDIEASGQFDLFIGGISANTDNTDLFVLGKDVITDNIDLFVSGFIPSITDNIDLFVSGVPAVLTNNIDLFTFNQPSINDNVDLFINSHNLITNNQDLFVQGVPSETNNIDLFIKGLDNITDNLDLHISGAAPSIDDNINLFISGSVGIINQSIDLFISNIGSISTTNNKVFAVGQNDNNQFNTSGEKTTLFEIPFSGGEPIDLDLGAEHSAFVTQSGSVIIGQTAGQNNKGQAGQGTVNDPVTLAPMVTSSDATLENILQINGGFEHSVVLDTSGNVWACGSNADGGLGISGSPDINYLEPTLSGGNITKVNAGSNVSYALQNDGKLLGVGRNTFGELALGNFSSPQNIWTFVGTGISGASNIVDFFNGDANLFVKFNDGTVQAAGRNVSGELGINNTDNTNVLTTVSGISGIDKVAGGANHTLFLLNNGEVYSVGDNNNGQLGIDTSGNNEITPVKVSGLPSNIIEIAAGFDISYALTGDNIIYAWGDNSNGALGQNSSSGILAIPTIMDNGSGFNVIKSSINSVSSQQMMALSSGTSPPDLFIQGLDVASDNFELFINNSGISQEIGLFIEGQAAEESVDFNFDTFLQTPDFTPQLIGILDENATSVTIEVWDITDAANQLLTLKDNICVEINSTSRWRWSTENLPIPSGTTRQYFYRMTSNLGDTFEGEFHIDTPESIKWFHPKERSKYIKKA